MGSHHALRESATKNRSLRHVGRALVIAVLGGPVNGAFAVDEPDPSACPEDVLNQDPWPDGCYEQSGERWDPEGRFVPVTVGEVEGLEGLACDALDRATEWNQATWTGECTESRQDALDAANDALRAARKLQGRDVQPGDETRIVESIGVIQVWANQTAEILAHEPQGLIAGQSSKRRAGGRGGGRGSELASGRKALAVSPPGRLYVGLPRSAADPRGVHGGRCTAEEKARGILRRAATGPRLPLKMPHR
ncbi:hypothetical protein [Streptomyces mirabilis]|uniref:hypothetical protein n=1 Tax=Streptomyces mirabilis TaxID=68239 RepID=UPI0036AAB2E7